MANVLITFAELELAVISDRIREAWHALREAGKWPGGTVPFGRMRLSRLRRELAARYDTTERERYIRRRRRAAPLDAAVGTAVGAKAARFFACRDIARRITSADSVITGTRMPNHGPDEVDQLRRVSREPWPCHGRQLTDGGRKRGSLHAVLLFRPRLG
jgi:hypothetical protein